MLQLVSLILYWVSLWCKLGLWHPPSWCHSSNALGSGPCSGLPRGLSGPTLRSFCPTGVSTGFPKDTYFIGNQSCELTVSSPGTNKSSGLWAILSLETYACKSLVFETHQGVDFSYLSNSEQTGHDYSGKASAGCPLDSGP